MTGEAHGREITLQEMMTLRAATESISSWLRGELEDRLETLRPLLAPRRFLGDHVRSGSREEVQGADRNFDQLQSEFRDVSGEPLKLRSRVDSPLDPIPVKLELHPWEYIHEAGNGGGAGGREARRVTIRSSMSWVILHGSPVSLSQARQMLTGAAQRSETDLRQLAINAVLMKIIFERSPGLVRLLEALRLEVDATTSPETGRVPLVRLSSAVPTFRPADSVIQSAIRLSGVPIFEELVDLEAARRLEDPLREKMIGLLRDAGV